jgi:hypothetical protein
MTFTGFNTKYPEYEVITPQTKLSFNVRSLNVQEEENLKGSLVTPMKVAEHLNKCLYDVITKKPDSIKDYDNFLRTLTLKDRDALLYGLYHITYEDIRNYMVKCGKCGKEHAVTVKASDTFNFIAYPGENILSQRILVKLPITKTVSAIVKQPSLFDEIIALKQYASRPGTSIEMVVATLIIEKFEEQRDDLKDPVIYDDRGDIIDAYLSLAPKDKREIHAKYEEEFGKYAISLKMQSFCVACSNSEVIELDLVDNFFRSIYSA